jgi:hypothetical protein
MLIEKIFSLESFLILLFLFNAYLFFDLIFPPKIKIIEPQNKIVVKTNSINFKGFVDKRSELFINELPVYFDNNGYFEQTFYLKEGLNKFIIKAKKFWGQEKIIEREIFYQK